MPQKPYAPETAIGTGAAEPLVDEYEAAVATPSVDEATVQPEAQNQPGRAASIDYSNDDLAEPTDDGKSTGEDFETRNQDDDTLAGASVGSVLDDAEVNKPAEEVRPEAPQATKRYRKAKSTV